MDHEERAYNVPRGRGAKGREALQTKIKARRALNWGCGFAVVVIGELHHAPLSDPRARARRFGRAGALNEPRRFADAWREALPRDGRGVSVRTRGNHGAGRARGRHGASGTPCSLRADGRHGAEGDGSHDRVAAQPDAR